MIRKITAGPSREDLFDALRLQHAKGKVSFTLTPEAQQSGSRIKVLTETLEVFVSGIGTADWSGNNWLLDLYDPSGYLGSQRLEASFNTNSRMGWVRPIP